MVEVTSVTFDKYSQAYRDYQFGKQMESMPKLGGGGGTVITQSFHGKKNNQQDPEELGLFRDKEGRVIRKGGILDEKGRIDDKKYVVDYEQESYRRLLEAQAKTAEYEASNPNRFIEEYKQILGANRENELALMNQRSTNDDAAQGKMYERMGILAKQQAESWLNTNKQLSEQAFGYRSRESAQQAEQEKDLQLSQIKENEGVESRRRSSERASALSAYKRL